MTIRSYIWPVKSEIHNSVYTRKTDRGCAQSKYRGYNKYYYVGTYYYQADIVIKMLMLLADLGL